MIWHKCLQGIGYLLMAFFALLFYCIFSSFIYDTVFFLHCYHSNSLLTSAVLLIGIYLGNTLLYH